MNHSILFPRPIYFHLIPTLPGTQVAPIPGILSQYPLPHAIHPHPTGVAYLSKYLQAVLQAEEIQQQTHPPNWGESVNDRPSWQRPDVREDR